MNRRVLLCLSATSVIAVVAPGSEGHDAVAFRDKDCGDFRTQAAAQRFFVRDRRRSGQRDRHRLDGDGDGRACESLP